MMRTKQSVRQEGLFPLLGETILLREIQLTDATERYLSWMNDPELTKFLEARFLHHTLESLERFVREQMRDPVHWMFAICGLETGEHIGNIKLGPISEVHGYGDIGLLVGQREWLGKGVGTEAIRLLRDFAFYSIGMRKLTSGMYSTNLAARRAFEKCGFVVECVLKSHRRFGDEYVDALQMALFRENDGK